MPKICVYRIPITPLLHFHTYHYQNFKKVQTFTHWHTIVNPQKYIFVNNFESSSCFHNHGIIYKFKLNKPLMKTRHVLPFI